MEHHKIHQVTPLDDYRLLIEFDNHQRRAYDVAPLLKKEMFSPLKNHALFKAVKVEQGGYAVYWNCDIDISEHELWVHGQEV